MNKFSFLILCMFFSFTIVGSSERGFDNGRWSNRDDQKETHYIWGAIHSNFQFDKVEQSGSDSDGPLYTSASISAEQNGGRHSLSAFAALGSGEDYKGYTGYWFGLAYINGPWRHTHHSDTDMDNYRGRVHKTFTRNKSADEEHDPLGCVGWCTAGVSVSGNHSSTGDDHYSVSYLPFLPDENEIEISND